MRGFSNAVYGALLSVNGLLIRAFEVPLTSLIRRTPARLIIVGGFLGVALGFGLTAFATTLPFLIITVVIWTAGEMLYSPASAAYVANLAPANQRGRYQGAWGLTAGAGLILAPAIGNAGVCVESGRALAALRRAWRRGSGHLRRLNSARNQPGEERLIHVGAL
jgi:MFS family permease